MVSCMAWNPYIHLRIRLSRAKIYGYDACVELVLDFEEDLFQMRDSLDRFYTNIDVASHCFDVLTELLAAYSVFQCRVSCVDSINGMKKS